MAYRSSNAHQTRSIAPRENKEEKQNKKVQGIKDMTNKEKQRNGPLCCGALVWYGLKSNGRLG